MCVFLNAKVCTGYKYEGKIIDCAYPGIDLYKVEPILVDLVPFKIDKTITLDNIPKELKDYLNLIEDHIDIDRSHWSGNMDGARWLHAQRRARESSRANCGQANGF